MAMQGEWRKEVPTTYQNIVKRLLKEYIKDVPQINLTCVVSLGTTFAQKGISML